ncbi:putative Ig domain-containing protein [Nocardioides pantholopis]|uniref:putative Ig domain-containing protein n=1 Tax=Nocardioides pantholopis TaxID=2483798 RepID=UPI000F08360E|nr:putative Ig domain-containing protein [Nocardioides pantholopis]
MLPKKTIVGAIAAALGAAALTVPAATAAPAQISCASPLLGEAAPAADIAEDAPKKFAKAATVNGERPAAFSDVADDETLWLDQCGMAFYVDPAPETPEVASAYQEAPADVLSLQSLPGAPVTIYLDFTGGKVTGTGWNDTYGPISAEPFSITAPASTSFDASERQAIFDTWQVVAEDYAPFEVNVTTADLGAAAIERTNFSDTTYGTRVLFAANTPMSGVCGCAGQAYLGIFDRAGADRARYQPAFVYPETLGRNGHAMGDAASHEIGHNLRLEHDGTATQDYLGAGDEATWAPIMGAGYGAQFSQWSQGEYPEANNPQDDTAIVAWSIPVREDDHAGSTTDAATLVKGRPQQGVITSRSDTDAFTFTARGTTTLRVTPSTYTNLHAGITILDASGDEVDSVSITPAVGFVMDPLSDPFGVPPTTWDVDLPMEPASYTAIVDGIGHLDPIAARTFSDYGSIGAYDIDLDTGNPVPDPLQVSRGADLTLWNDEWLDDEPLVTTTGGTRPYLWTSPDIPEGLGIDHETGLLSGSLTDRQPRTGRFTVAVTDARAARPRPSWTSPSGPPGRSPSRPTRSPSSPASSAPCA